METKSNKRYEMNHSAYVPVVICYRKQGHYSNRRICEMVILDEFHYNPANINFLSVLCLALKSSHTEKYVCVSNQLGDIHTISGESGIGKLTTAKSKSSRLSYTCSVSLPLESILSTISRYEAYLTDSVVSFIASSSGYIKWS
jgi:hypothetical protein